MSDMQVGFVLPGGTATEQLEQAMLAEQSGWDGVFVWEAAYGVDAWTLLAAMAQRTERVRLGTMLTPLPWRRPWKVASQVATLDQLSGGRAILAVGLGAVGTGLGTTGEPTDRRERAALLDEGIDLIAGLFEGKVHYSGERYGIDLEEMRHSIDLDRTVAPVQKPRPPIWVVGAWPRPKSMRRVLRCDGLIPVAMEGNGFRETTPEDITAMIAWLEEQGGVRPGFDIVMEGETSADDPSRAASTVAPWAEAGCTWWLEARWASPGADTVEQLRVVQERIEAGPPRPSFGTATP